MAPQDGLTATLTRPETSAPKLQRSPPLLRVDGLSVSYGPHEVVTDVGFELGPRPEPRAHRRVRLRQVDDRPRGAAAAPAAVGTPPAGSSSTARRCWGSPSAASGRCGDGPSGSSRRTRATRSTRCGRSAPRHRRPPHSWTSPDKAIRKQLILETFAQVGLDDPQRVYDSYPHQLSGGMLQRVLIGLAVLPRPALLVADEPTSALDVTIQKRILDLLSRLQHDLDISLLLITHDLAIAAERADSLVVLKDGVIQEAGSTATVFSAPASAYARKLHADVPALNPDRYAELRDRGLRHLGRDSDQTPKIEVSGVTKTFTVDGKTLTAVDDVSFSVPAGTTHALVGESGSGKTTAIRLLLGLEEPDTGNIAVAGEQVNGRSHAVAARGVPPPSARLPEPVHLARSDLEGRAAGARAARPVQDRNPQGAGRVGSARHWPTSGSASTCSSRKPAALSGGQRQRVAIARSLVLKPDVIVLDEPTSALDVSVQADIVEVLLSLQANLGLTYVFVSHDLALVRQFAHTVSVMHRGRIVEHGTVADIFDNPRQPYTRSLLASIPSGVAHVPHPSRRTLHTE